MTNFAILNMLVFNSDIAAVRRFQMTNNFTEGSAFLQAINTVAGKFTIEIIFA